MTKDHVAECPDEQRRVEGLGGQIKRDERGTFRLQGLTMTTAGLGDEDVDEVAGRPVMRREPELYSMALSPEDVVLHCSDGLFEGLIEHLLRFDEARFDQISSYLANHVDKEDLASGLIDDQLKHICMVQPTTTRGQTWDTIWDNHAVWATHAKSMIVPDSLD